MKAFTGYDKVERIISQGETRASVKLRTGLQIDMRIVEKEAFKRQLCPHGKTTGCQDFNRY